MFAEKHYPHKARPILLNLWAEAALGLFENKQHPVLKTKDLIEKLGLKRLVDVGSLVKVYRHLQKIDTFLYVDLQKKQQ